MKKIIFSAALLMGLATISFAGNPKGETKDAKASTTETANKSKSGEDELFWYRVSYVGNTNGYIPANAPLVAHDVESNVNSPCDDGSARDCLRGFAEEQTTMTTSAGDGQIKTDEPK